MVYQASVVWKRCCKRLIVFYGYWFVMCLMGNRVTIATYYPRNPSTLAKAYLLYYEMIPYLFHGRGRRAIEARGLRC